MKNAFELLFQMSNPRQPDKLQTDAGKEFVNKDVQKFLKYHGVLHFVSHSDKKAAVVERFNRTLKKYGPISQRSKQISILINCKIL